MGAATLAEHPHFGLLVFLGSWMSFASGFINGVFLISSATFISSVNGLLSLVARDYVSSGNYVRGSLLLAQIVTFFIGATVAGAVFDDPLSNEPLAWTKCAVGSICISLMVLLCMGVQSIGTADSLIGAVFVAAFAMGFQNAMGSYLSKGALRTTHQSGGVTDLGVILGQVIQRKFRPRASLPKAPELWKVKSMLPVLLSYFGGGFAGVAAQSYGSFWYTMLPFGISGLFSAGFLVWQRLGCGERKALKGEDDDHVSLEDQFSGTTHSLQ